MATMSQPYSTAANFSIFYGIRQTSGTVANAFNQNEVGRTSHHDFYVIYITRQQMMTISEETKFICDSLMSSSVGAW